ncbi:hypothetical protein PoB_007665000 [Plakobranchus ocellatus]|uniref:Uncharacterized protein n=1 Tax=Plakobranchus ocellatus TaxID=259542 RepID=A0AAV4E1C8_9GAST|nr:hypothetical protein PoB_007665000 [Plakobranchus ocellatus]
MDIDDDENTEEQTENDGFERTAPSTSSAKLSCRVSGQCTEKKEPVSQDDTSNRNSSNRSAATGTVITGSAVCGSAAIGSAATGTTATGAQQQEQ